MSEEPILLYFLDVEKAFDWMEWSFLKQVIGRMNMGLRVRQWMDLIYEHHLAKILAKRILIDRGVRQDCPLSPLLFNMVIETLAIAVRLDSGLLGVEAGIFRLNFVCMQMMWFFSIAKPSEIIRISESIVRCFF